MTNGGNNYIDTFVLGPSQFAQKISSDEHIELAHFVYDLTFGMYSKFSKVTVEI